MDVDDEQTPSKSSAPVPMVDGPSPPQQQLHQSELGVSTGSTSRTVARRWRLGTGGGRPIDRLCLHRPVLARAPPTPGPTRQATSQPRRHAVACACRELA